MRGYGGFGEVWEPERDSDRQRFAKKRLSATADVEGIRRFQRRWVESSAKGA